MSTADSNRFLHSLTKDGFSLIHRPHSSGIGGGVGLIIHDSYKYHKVDTPNYSSFENIVISVSVLCRTLLLVVIYCPPGPCSSSFLDEFMFFDCFLSSVGCNYFICCDFNIHIDAPNTDSYKLESLVESCNLTQSVTISLTCTVISLISFFPPVIKIGAYVLISVNSYLIIQSFTVLLTLLCVLLTIKKNRRYHHINMSDFQCDPKEMTFVKCLANSVSQLLTDMLLLCPV